MEIILIILLIILGGVIATVGYMTIKLLTRLCKAVEAAPSHAKAIIEQAAIPAWTMMQQPAAEAEQCGSGIVGSAAETQGNAASQDDAAADEPEDVPEEEEDEEPESNEPEPSIDNTQDLIFFQKLEALMFQKKLFSEPELTRDDLAAEIGTNRTYLIRSIKMATGMTFNEYLNSLRVNYAATLLATTDEQLDNIGIFAGFRSKSAYYRAFTAANNCTPSEYRKRNR